MTRYMCMSLNIPDRRIRLVKKLPFYPARSRKFTIFLSEALENLGYNSNFRQIISYAIMKNTVHSSIQNILKNKKINNHADYRDLVARLKSYRNIELHRIANYRISVVF